MMKKRFLFPLTPLFIVAFLLTGCEKKESSVTQKITEQEKSEAAEIMTDTEIMIDAEDTKIVDDNETSVTSGDTPDDTKFEGSQSLKRYIAD